MTHIYVCQDSFMGYTPHHRRGTPPFPTLGTNPRQNTPDEIHSAYTVHYRNFSQVSSIISVYSTLHCRGYPLSHKDYSKTLPFFIRIFQKGASSCADFGNAHTHAQKTLPFLMRNLSERRPTYEFIFVSSVVFVLYTVAVT